MSSVSFCPCSSSTKGAATPPLMEGAIRLCLCKYCLDATLSVLSITVYSVIAPANKDNPIESRFLNAATAELFIIGPDIAVHTSFFFFMGSQRQFKSKSYRYQASPQQASVSSLTTHVCCK